MGIDFIALLKHELDASAVRALPAALAPEAAPDLARVTEALGQIRASARVLVAGEPLWRIDEAEMASANPEEVWASGGPFELVGPHNLHVGLFRRTCDLSDGTRWQMFLDDRHLQLALRRCCYELARVLGSPSAIYAPDDVGVVLWEDVPYEQIPARLSEWYGPPAATLATVTKAKSPAYTVGQAQSSGVYYIDTFADFAMYAQHKE